MVGENMANIAINSYFHPFRLSLKSREPVRLTVEIENKSQEAKMTSLSISLPRTELAFDKSGLSTEIVKRLPQFKPGERLVYYFDVHPKHLTTPGEHEVKLVVREHFQSFDLVEKESKVRSSLTVI